MFSSMCDPTELNSRDDSINYALHFFCCIVFFSQSLVSQVDTYFDFIRELDPKIIIVLT